MKKFISILCILVSASMYANTITPTSIPGSPFYCQHNFSMTFLTSGGVAPYTYSTMSGTKPPGLTLNAKTGYFGGVFSDTVQTSYTFRIRSTDANGDTTSRSYSMTVKQNTRSVNQLTTMWAANFAPTRSNLFDTWISMYNLVNSGSISGSYFKQNGNSFSAPARIGTNDNNAFLFETVDTLRGVWSTNGFLGLNNAVPTAMLDIKGRNNSASNYALRVGGSSLANIFTVLNDGHVGILNNTPSAYLHLAAGDTGVSSAPLKLTFGSLLNTPEDGAVEASGTDLYFSSSNGRFKTAQIITASDTMNVPGVAATGGTYTKTLTVTGVADGDVVSLGTSNAMQTDGGFFFAWASGTNQVKIQFMNVAGGTLNPAAGTIKLTIFKN